MTRFQLILSVADHNVSEKGVVKVEYHMNDPLLFVNGVLELT